MLTACGNGCIAHLTDELAAAVCLVHIIDGLEQTDEVLPAESLRVSSHMALHCCSSSRRLPGLSQLICLRVSLPRRARGTA